MGLFDQDGSPPPAPGARDYCTSMSLLGASRTRDAMVVVPVTCGRWDCPSCQRYKARRWRAIAVSGCPERLLTLTARPHDGETPREMRRRLGRAWSLLVQRIRRRPYQIEYLAVWELTRAGWPHVHVLTRGDYIPQQWLSRAWRELTGSPVVDIRRVRDDRGAARYVTAYLSKAVARTYTAIRPQRLLSRSRHWVLLDTGDDARSITERMVWTLVRSDPDMVATQLHRSGWVRVAVGPHGTPEWQPAGNSRPVTNWADGVRRRMLAEAHVVDDDDDP